MEFLCGRPLIEVRWSNNTVPAVSRMTSISIPFQPSMTSTSTSCSGESREALLTLQALLGCGAMPHLHRQG